MSKPFGTVIKRSGKYIGRFTKDGRQHYLTARETEQEARNDLVLVQAAIISGTWHGGHNTTGNCRVPLLIQDWVDAWLEDAPASGMSPNTIKSYGSNVMQHVVRLYPRAPVHSRSVPTRTTRSPQRCGRRKPRQGMTDDGR